MNKVCIFFKYFKQRILGKRYKKEKYCGDQCELIVRKETEFISNKQ